MSFENREKSFGWGWWKLGGSGDRNHTQFFLFLTLAIIIVFILEGSRSKLSRRTTKLSSTCCRHWYLFYACFSTAIVCIHLPYVQRIIWLTTRYKWSKYTYWLRKSRVSNCRTDIHNESNNNRREYACSIYSPTYRKTGWIWLRRRWG
jgi:hypothetical protein